MSKALLFGKIAEPELNTINFNNHFQNLRPYGKTNEEVSRIPRILTVYQKLR